MKPEPPLAMSDRSNARRLDVDPAIPPATVTEIHMDEHDGSGHAPPGIEPEDVATRFASNLGDLIGQHQVQVDAIWGDFKDWLT